MNLSNILRHNNKLLALIASLVLSALYSTIAHEITNAPILSLLLINSVSFYLLLRNLDMLKTSSLRTVYVFVSMLKLSLLIFNAHTKSVFFTGVDWGNYNTYALNALENSSSILDLYSHSLDLFVYGIALIYQVFGTNINQIYFYVFPLSLILFRFVYKTIFLITNSDKRAGLGALLAMMWPVNIVMSISVLRETGIQMFVAMSFYYFVAYLKGMGKAYKAFLPAIAAGLMHSGMFVVPLVYAYAMLQRRKKVGYKILHLPAIIAILVILTVIVASPLWQSTAKQFSNIDSVESITSSLQIKNEALGNANTNYISTVPENGIELLLSMPYRLFMFIFSPMVWQVYSLETAIAFIIDALPILMLILSIILIVKYRRRLTLSDRNTIFVGLMCILFTFLVFSVGTNNYGTAMRHRSKVLPISIIIVVSYYSTQRVNQRLEKET